MSIFADILDVHTQALTKKGYDQKGLGLDGTPEDLLNRLEETFGDIVRNNIWARKPIPFKVKITGRFDEDDVDFRFEYHYDPKRPRLYLHVLRAKMSDKTKTWFINSNNPQELPTSKKVVEELNLINMVPKSRPTTEIRGPRQHPPYPARRH